MINSYKSRIVVFLLILFLAPVFYQPVFAEDNLIDQVLDGAHRDENFKKRDQYRHPKETLNFFGINSENSVIEVTPGYGWYAEILAPLLRDNGSYTYASYKLTEGINPFFVKVEKAFTAKMQKYPKVYEKLNWVHFEAKNPELAPNSLVDKVVTFRNVHNWAQAGTSKAMFKGFYDALKHGGVLGLVEHRAKPGTSLDDQIKSGYMTEDFVIQMAESVGFRLDEKSEINANPKDTKDHVDGVWNLLPNLRNISETDKSKMIEIGESDRMTLRFIKD